MLRFAVLLVPALVLPALVGCGGSQGGQSLTQQYQTALKISDASIRSGKLITIAESQKKAGDSLGASSSLSAASDSAYAVTDPSSRANAMNKVGAAYGRAGDMENAKKVLKDTSKTIAEIEDADIKIRLLSDLAATTGTYLKNPDAAAEHLSNAEKAVDSLQSPLAKVAAQAKIATAYSKIEREADAQRVLDSVLSSARGMSDAKDKSESLAEVAAALQRAKQDDKAKPLFAEALQASEEISSEDQRAYALLHIGQKLSAAGDKGQAREVLSKAQDFALKVTDGSIKGSLMEEVDSAIAANNK